MRCLWSGNGIGGQEQCYQRCGSGGVGELLELLHNIPPRRRRSCRADGECMCGGYEEKDGSAEQKHNHRKGLIIEGIVVRFRRRPPS